MDTGELVTMPPPTCPKSSVGQRVRAERAALEELRSSINGYKQPWEPRRRIIDRFGTLSAHKE